MTTAEAIAAALGAAPGLGVAARAAWRQRAAPGRTEPAAAPRAATAVREPPPGRRFDLWHRPHCFVRPGRRIGGRNRRSGPMRGVPGGLAFALAGAAAAVALVRAFA